MTAFLCMSFCALLRPVPFCRLHLCCNTRINCLVDPLMSLYLLGKTLCLNLWRMMAKRRTTKSMPMQCASHICSGAIEHAPWCGRSRPPTPMHTRLHSSMLRLLDMTALKSPACSRGVMGVLFNSTKKKIVGVCGCVFVCLCLCVFVFVCMYIYIYIYVCVCVYIYIYVCTTGSILLLFVVLL